MENWVGISIGYGKGLVGRGEGLDFFAIVLHWCFPSLEGGAIPSLSEQFVLCDPFLTPLRR